MAARMTASNATGPIDGVSKRIGWYVNHDDVLVRFVSLWVVVASVFTAAWILSYFVLPQGLLRGGNPGAATG
jgi:phage shock protein PspC (stress-responsive transcriptional regulator)